MIFSDLINQSFCDSQMIRYRNHQCSILSNFVPPISRALLPMVAGQKSEKSSMSCELVWLPPAWADLNLGGTWSREGTVTRRHELNTYVAQPQRKLECPQLRVGKGLSHFLSSNQVVANPPHRPSLPAEIKLSVSTRSSKMYFLFLGFIPWSENVVRSVRGAHKTSLSREK